MQTDDILLMAYVDGEVDAATAREIEAAIAADPALGARARAMRDASAYARAALADVLHEQVPHRLLAAVATGARPGPSAAPIVRLTLRRPTARVLAWAMAASLAALAIGVGGFYETGKLQTSAPEGLHAASSNRWLDHVAGFYNVFADKLDKDDRLLVDFNADAIPELEKWFSARLKRKLSVPDLSANGFTTQGGRLLIINGRPAAQFLYYGDGGALLGLVIAFTDDADQIAQQESRAGVNIVHWRKDGYAYALVGKLDLAKLQAIADLTYPDLSAI
ncbi:MAG: anti-sigma factor family protein [Pseudomonadota bacterium]